MRPETTTSDSTTYTTTHTTTHTTTTTRKSTSGSTNVVLITGGQSSSGPGGTERSAEIFVPDLGTCVLPNLPISYLAHTQQGGMLCGGYHRNTTNTCRQWNSTEGKFIEKPVHEFESVRYALVSWTPVSEEKTFLLGGGRLGSGSQNTSTIVTPDKFNGTYGFYLEYAIFGACSIPDPETDTVIITGGNCWRTDTFDSYKDTGGNCNLTSLYNEKGFVEYFGNLMHPRRFHGCTSYVADKKRVCQKCYVHEIFYFFFKRSFW